MPKRIKTGGRQKGSLNKSKDDIKELLDSTIDFSVVIGKLYELVNGVTVKRTVGREDVIYTEKPDATAAKILLEYRFGKPLQTVQASVEVTDLTITRKIIGSSS